jgi:diguanylate cyclase (GGDEF)-like protein
MAPNNKILANDPRRLLKAFSLLSIISILCILALASIGIKRIFSAEMMHAAEETAINVGNSLFELERDVLLKPSSIGTSVEVAAGDFAALDQRMKRFLRTFNMYKIKVFSKEGMIIYSTDHKIIGKLEGDNQNLLGVLNKGVIFSKLERKELMKDFVGTEHKDIDVVETYVPIRDGQSIVGAFEVYVDTTSTRGRIAVAIRNSVIMLLGVLALVFGCLYLPVRQGMRSLGRAQDKLQTLASTDVLTGISNRRHVLERVHEEHARMQREKREISRRTLAVSMIDIDFFKKVNDKYGHPAGDYVLREVASRLRASIRIYDTLGRYGGEEFLAVMPNTTLEEALIVSERMHKAVGFEPVTFEGITIPVTVSIGVASSYSPEEDSEHAIKRADDALYRAKETGRDRVLASEEFASEEFPSSGVSLKVV